jgi:hypothetical protein
LVTKEILAEISTETSITVNELLIDIRKGKSHNNINGTYVHPLLLTHIAYWISPLFAVKTSLWIEEWKKFSDENFSKYYNSLLNLEPSQNNNKEKTDSSKNK